jgi:ADP-ribosyl-[dinitrogen reductase] hydrolase
MSTRKLGEMTRVHPGILGALVGDALGVPFEFMDPVEIPARQKIEMHMPGGFRKTYPGVPYGTWSDDGSQLLCLYESLISGPDFDAEHFGSLLIRWYRDAHHQAGGTVFDCGNQTAKALANLERGLPAEQCGGTDNRSNGNGSLMRSLPVAIVGLQRGWDAATLIRVACRQSCVTHAHPVAQVCCALYVLIATRLLQDPVTPMEEVIASSSTELTMQCREAQSAELESALNLVMAYPKANLLRGTGYVVDSLWSTLQVVGKATSYSQAVRDAIALGHDTDTTACLVGGLAGIRWGMQMDANSSTHGIPMRWLQMIAWPPESVKMLESATA